MYHRLLLRTGASRQSVSTGFFQGHPLLVAHAERVLHEPAVERVRYFYRPDFNTILTVQIHRFGNYRDAICTLEVEDSAAPWNLTRREHEILSGLAVGLTNADLSRLTFCSRSTVSTHVERILSKLQVSNRGAASTVAVSMDALLAPLLNADTVQASPGLRVLLDISDPPSREHTPVSRHGAAAVHPQKRPLLIGSLHSNSTARLWETRALMQASRLAVEHINSRGGVNGRSLEHVSVPVESDVGAALAVLHSKNVDAITLGNFDEESALEIFNANVDYGAPILHTMVAPALTAATRESGRTLNHVFQVSASEHAYVAGFFRTLRQIELTAQWKSGQRKALLVLRTGEETGAVAARAVELGGRDKWEVEIVYVDDKETIAKWDDVVDRIAREGVEAVLLGTFIESHLLSFLGKIRTFGHRPLIYSLWAPSTPGFLERAGWLAEGLVWATVIGSYPNKTFHAFEERYASSFGEQPGSGTAPIHFDLVQLLASSWSQVNIPWDFAASANMLSTITHRGLTGRYHFGSPKRRGLTYPDDTKDVSWGHIHLVHQVQDGVNRVISPPSVANAPFRPL